MLVDPITCFVDRERELRLFRSMLRGEMDKRILRVVMEGEKGKTWFLLRLLHECEARRPPVPVLLVDFDQRRSNTTLDYRGVAGVVRRHLGDALTPAICAYEEAMRPRGPFVAVGGDAGDSAGVDFGRRGRFRDADISHVAGRDHIETGDIHVQAPGPISPEERARARADLGRAVCNDLVSLGEQHDRAVLLLDTFEYADSETCTWLERWIFEPMRRLMPHLLVVAAGQPQCLPFFDEPAVWSGLVARIDRFSVFEQEDVVTYFERRGIAVAQAEVRLLFDVTRTGGPARMGDLGDLLAQARGDAW